MNSSFHLFSELCNLELQSIESMKAAFAKGTWNNISTQFKSFQNFCHQFHLQSLPASASVIRLYMQFLSQKGLTPDTINNYINGVKVIHFLSNFDTTQFEHFSLGLMKKGISRLHKHVPHQALPITPVILLDILTLPMLY